MIFNPLSMESAVSKSLASASALNPLMLRLQHPPSKAPSKRLSPPSRLISHRLCCICNNRFRRPGLDSVPAPSPASSSVGNGSLAFPPSRASAGGNGGRFGGESGGGGCGSNSGDSESKSVAAAAEEAAALPSDVILLDVGGMMCEGCTASVKRILESQPQVSSASVNLTTETAIVWPVSEATAASNWQRELGEALAKHLTNCGFASTIRGVIQWLSVMNWLARASQLAIGVFKTSA